jgi:hypothetical protein
MQTALQGSAMSSVNNCELYAYMWHFSRRHTLSLTRDFPLEIIIKRIVFLDFIHRLVSQEQTKLRHQTMDKAQKHNSFNTNTPSSESYKKEIIIFIGMTATQVQKAELLLQSK